jgi:hypothetical protein
VALGFELREALLMLELLHLLMAPIKEKKDLRSEDLIKGQISDTRQAHGRRTRRQGRFWASLTHFEG